MDYIIYVDVYFFVNFFMNGLLLCLLGWSEGRQKAPVRGRRGYKIMLGALIGGILSCLIMVLFPEISFFLRFFLVNGLVGYLMIWIAFDYKGIKRRFQAVGRLYLLEIVLSGILNLFLKQQEGFLKNSYPMEKQENLNFLSVAGISFFSVLVLREALKHYREERRIHSHLYKVQMFHKGKSYEGIGLLDTGNHLREPITGSAVVVVQYQVVQKLLGKAEAWRILSYGKGRGLEEMPENLVKWIPYHSLGEQHGLMPGVLIEKMIIYQEEKEQICEDVLIGIMEEELSGGQLYQLILHEEFFEFC